MPERPMALTRCLLPLLFAATAASAMPAPSPGLPGDIASGYEKVARELLCYCGCARQSIYDCTCGEAQNLRNRIEGALRSGQTSDQVIAAFVKEQGEQVRVVPLRRGFNRLAWIGPGIAILLASGGVMWLLLRWSAPGAPAPEDLGPRPAPSAAEESRIGAYRERMERDLSRIDQ